MCCMYYVIVITNTTTVFAVFDNCSYYTCTNAYDMSVRTRSFGMRASTLSGAWVLDFAIGL